MFKGYRKGPMLRCEQCKARFYAAPCMKRRFCSRKCADARHAFTPKNFWKKIIRGKKDECWLWQEHRDKNGYGLGWDGKRPRRAHALALELTRDRKIPRGKMVLHTCDNPPCCNPKHLYIGNAKKNARDREARGRARRPYQHFDVPQHRRPTGARNGTHTHPECVARGAAAGSAKVTAKAVQIIRQLRASGATLSSIGKKFNLGTSQVWRIARGESWAHLQEN